MRLLQVSLRSLLLYSMVLVLISIPVSLFSIREFLNKEIDQNLAIQTDQFLQHIKSYEYLSDLETDLGVLDHLSHNIHIAPYPGKPIEPVYETIQAYDSIERQQRPFRQLSSSVYIKKNPYMLAIRMSLVDNEDLILAIGSVQIVLIVLLAGGLLLLNRSLSRKLWKPFYDTLNQLKAYELDKSESIHLGQTGIIEFDDLNKTIHYLTDRNRRVFLQQKEFIENASHELQTPLAIFQSKLDNLMQSAVLMEHEATTIMELEQTAQRMARLNKNLLLLSKIDNEQFTALEEIDIADLIQGVLANLRPVAAIDHIAMETDIHALRITANKTLIEVLLTNLFHNAVRYAGAEGKILVQLQERTLRIANTGQPLKMSAEKMFERFSKESVKESSTGLGLAIVRKICDTCGYTVRYDFHNELHTFSIIF